MFKYLLAVFMIVTGIATMFSPVTPMDGALGIVYGSRLSLVAFGTLFSFSGGSLLYGKIKRSRKWTGLGLMLIYLCFMFATFLNGVALGWEVSAWFPNLIGSLITGALYLRWRFKTAYVDPNHFVDYVDKHRMDDNAPPTP